MGVLDFIFGNDEDDLEAIEEKKEPHPIESVPFFSRPIGASKMDRQVGMDEAGNPVFQTLSGTRYTVRVNPDQRTIRQKVVDAAPVVAEAVTDYVKDPKLPTMQQVGQFAKDTVTGTVEDIENMMTGKGTMGDVFLTATGMGLGAKGADITSKALTGKGIIPDEPGTSYVGLFLPANKNPKYESKVDRANFLKQQGATRGEIWKETGLWQLAERGDWLTELDDSKAEIALTKVFNPNNKPKKKFKEVEQTVTQTIRGKGLPQSERISLRINAKKQMMELQALLKAKALTPEEVAARARQIQDDLNAKINPDDIGDQTETFTVTKKVEIPTKPLVKGRSPTMKGGKSTLDEVLQHDDFFDEMSEMGIDVTKTTAEAGRRKDTSAGESAAGIQYRSEPYSDVDKNRVSSFTNAANWFNAAMRGEPRNARDGELAELVKAGKMTEEEARAEMILSTMLHEVQHLIDAEVRSNSGTGFNWRSSKEMRNRFSREHEKQLQFIANTKHNEDSRRALALLHELQKTPVDPVEITGDSVMGIGEMGVKYSLDDITRDIYGSGQTPDNVLTGWNSFKGFEVLELGKIFDEWKFYKTVMEQFPPENPSHYAAKRDAKFDFIKRVTGTKESGEPGYGYANKINNHFVHKQGTQNTANKRARANAAFHLLDAGYLDNLIDDFYEQINSGLAQNIKANNKQIYNREGGETKSRLVQARRDMTAEERKAVPPYEMLDIDEELIWFADENGNWIK